MMRVHQRPDYGAIARAHAAAQALPLIPAGQPAYVTCPACSGRIRITAREGTTEGRCTSARCTVRWPL